MQLEQKRLRSRLVSIAGILGGIAFAAMGVILLSDVDVRLSYFMVGTGVLEALVAGASLILPRKTA